MKDIMKEAVILKGVKNDVLATLKDGNYDAKLVHTHYENTNRRAIGVLINNRLIGYVPKKQRKSPLCTIKSSDLMWGLTAKIERRSVTINRSLKKVPVYSSEKERMILETAEVTEHEPERDQHHVNLPPIKCITPDGWIISDFKCGESPFEGYVFDQIGRLIPEELFRENALQEETIRLINDGYPLSGYGFDAFGKLIPFSLI